MKKKILIISAVVFCAFFCQNVLAQEAGLTTVSPSKAKTLSNRDWQETIDGIRADTKSLLDRNEKLNSEYSFLKEKLSGLKGTITKIKQEIIDQEEENKKLKDYRLNQQRNIGDSRQQLKKGEKEIQSAEAEKAQFLKQLSIVEEKVKLQQDKLDSLQAQKRELMLDFKMQEYYRAELKSGETSQIKKLKRQYQRVQKEEDRLAQVVENLTKKSREIPDEVKVLKQENRGLEDEISLLEKQRRVQVKKNERAVKDNQRLADLSTRIPSELIKEKHRAANSVLQIEKKLESVKRAVAASASIIEQKRALMDEIMGMDSENQQMREQITETLNKISALKKVISELSGE